MADQGKASETGVRQSDPVTALDRLRDQLWGFPSTWPSTLFPHLDEDFVPLADIEETDDAWIVDVELPGTAKKDIDVQVKGRTVVICGERKEKEREGILRQKKRVTGTFRYEVSLPGEIDEDDVEASLDHGELTVRLPKREADQPRRIELS